MTSKNETTNSPIHQFTNLKYCIKTREPFKPPFNDVLFLIYYLKNILGLAYSFDFFEHLKFMNWWIGEFVVSFYDVTNRLYDIDVMSYFFNEKNNTFSSESEKGENEYLLLCMYNIVCSLEIWKGNKVLSSKPQFYIQLVYGVFHLVYLIITELKSHMTC